MGWKERRRTTTTSQGQDVEIPVAIHHLGVSVALVADTLETQSGGHATAQAEIHNRLWGHEARINLEARSVRLWWWISRERRSKEILCSHVYFLNWKACIGFKYCYSLFYYIFVLSFLSQDKQITSTLTNLQHS